MCTFFLSTSFFIFFSPPVLLRSSERVAWVGIQHLDKVKPPQILSNIQQAKAEAKKKNNRKTPTYYILYFCSIYIIYKKIWNVIWYLLKTGKNLFYFF